MSPTLYRDGNKRFFFFSREEARMHVHVKSPDGEAKYWLEPEVALATAVGFSNIDLRKIQIIVEEHADEFKRSWQNFFGS